MDDAGLYALHVSAKNKTAKKSPVLVMLHGVGSNERSLMSLVDHLDPRLEIFSLRGPLVMGPQNYAWFHVNFTPQGPLHNREEAEASRLLLKNFIMKLKENPEVDPEQIFLLGFSQGAIMNLSLALTEPQLVRGVIPIAGRTLQEVQAIAKTRVYESSPQVLLLHGRNDSKLPLFHGEASETVLKAARFSYQFKQYPADHEITHQMIVDIQSWLEEQLRER